MLGAGWQRCRVHFMRNLLCRVGRTRQPVVSAAVKTIFAEKDRDAAHKCWREVADGLREHFPDVTTPMDDAEHNTLAYMAFDGELRRKPHSTNPLERLNKEIKRRAGVIGIFPNRAAIIRLVGALMLEQNGEWDVSRRYMSMESLNQICNEENGAAPIAVAEQENASDEEAGEPGSYTTGGGTINEATIRPLSVH